MNINCRYNYLTRERDQFPVSATNTIRQAKAGFYGLHLMPAAPLDSSAVQKNMFGSSCTKILGFELRWLNWVEVVCYSKMWLTFTRVHGTVVGTQ
jgi:hypothetical protein